MCHLMCHLIFINSEFSKIIIIINIIYYYNINNMSWATCYSGSNNIHFNYPPLMDDSRLFSDYNSSVLNDDVLKKRNNIQTNTDYRKYLQVNSDAIIRNNQLIACNECSVCPYYNNTNVTMSSNTPYIFQSTLSQDQPYGYETSNLKNLYLTQQQLDSQKHVTKYIVREQK